MTITKKKSSTKTIQRIPPAIAKLVKQRYGMATEITRLAGCDRSYISRVLSGKKAPSRRFLKALVEVLSKDSEMTLSAAASIELLQMMDAAQQSQRKDRTQKPGTR